MNNMFVNSVVVELLSGAFISNDELDVIKGRLNAKLKKAQRKGKGSALLEKLELAVNVMADTPTSFAKEVISILATGEDSFAQCYLDVFELWNSLLTQDGSGLIKWEKPWIVNADYAETFKGGKRFIYTGVKNQLNAAMAIAQNPAARNYSGLLITKAKAQSIISRGEGEIELADYPHLCYFASPVEAKNGATTSSPFSSFPVWSIEQFKDLLSARELKLLNSMIEVRESENAEFKPVDLILETIIKGKVQRSISDHSIEVRKDKAAAYYNGLGDYIAMPSMSQFKSELEYFSTWCHELAHSTKAILKRSKRYDKKTVGQQYAIEEVIAETTAFLAIKRLESELNAMGLMTDDIQAAFLDTYNLSKAYTYGWGQKFEEAFLEIMDCKYQSSLFAAVIKDVFSCHLVISTGTHFGAKIKR